MRIGRSRHSAYIALVSLAYVVSRASPVSGSELRFVRFTEPAGLLVRWFRGEILCCSEGCQLVRDPMLTVGLNYTITAIGRVLC